MKKLFILFFILLQYAIYADNYKESNWKSDLSLLSYLSKKGVSHSVYFSLTREDKELCSEIIAGQKFKEFFDDNNQYIGTTIPISEELEISVFKQNGKFTLDLIPIEYEEGVELLNFTYKDNLYDTTFNLTNNLKLSHEIVSLSKKTLPYKNFKNGQNFAIHYTTKIKDGKVFGTPFIHSLYAEIDNEEFFVIYNEEDGGYYNEKGLSLTKSYFEKPLNNYKRISSKFTYKRWHPVLKKYRAHLGVDFAAKRGTPIYATTDGKISFLGRKGGYGKSIFIKHKNNYKSVYAHLSKYAKGMRAGKEVKQGDLIGYVGSTGVSTGPHLHFGLYKNNRAINPLTAIKKTQKEIASGKKDKFLSYAKSEVLFLKSGTNTNLSTFKYTLKTNLFKDLKFKFLRNGNYTNIYTQ